MRDSRMRVSIRRNIRQAEEGVSYQIHHVTILNVHDNEKSHGSKFDSIEFPANHHPRTNAIDRDESLNDDFILTKRNRKNVHTYLDPSEPTNTCYTHTSHSRCFFSPSDACLKRNLFVRRSMPPEMTTTTMIRNINQSVPESHIWALFRERLL